MRKTLTNPIVLMLAAIALFILGIFMARAVDCHHAFWENLLADEHAFIRFAAHVGFVLTPIAAGLALFVILRAIKSWDTQSVWAQRASLTAVALLLCFSTWTGLRWSIENHYCGCVLISIDRVDPAIFETEEPEIIRPVTIPQAVFSEEPGEVITEETLAAMGFSGNPRMLFSSSTSQPSSQPATSTSRPAGQDFPVVELKYRDRIENINLLSDYGYIIDWPKDTPPSFYLFDRKKRTRIKTNRWESFIRELKRLPNGVKIDRISKCSVSFAWAMPSEKHKELTSVLKSKAIDHVNHEDLTKHTTFCYCETRGIRILHDEAKQPTTQPNTEKPGG
ncbi:MAG: hypothetical protein HN350_12425 [Phycisphaerales bacterium]|jgi:hypothetical protein|nr:hypothetical protein [Phycisphaerales bacterium]